MYVPKHFAEPSAEAIVDSVAAHEFALLVTSDAAGIEATHLPLHFEPGQGVQGRLIGHLARANPQARILDDRDVMAVFSGPHGYVSPRWYADALAVPTWNYVAVHFYGKARTIEDPVRLREILLSLTRRYETDGSWSMEKLPERYLDGMLRGIVGVEIDVTRIDAKFKLSQNRSVEDRRRVVAALRADGRAGDIALAEAMQRFTEQG